MEAALPQSLRYAAEVNGRAILRAAMPVFGRDLGRGFLITFGVILLLIGGLLSIPVLWILGIVLAVIGGVLWLVGAMDHKVGPRRHYW